MSQSHDDEGIIDLTALASPKRAATGAVFQSEPPPAAFARDAGTSSGSPEMSGSASKAKTIAAIAGASLLLILVGTGVAFAFRGEKAVAIAAHVPPPPIARIAPPPLAPAAASTSSPSDNLSTPDPDTSDVKKAKRAVKARAVGFKSKSTSTDAPRKPSVPAADPCHCHGDFQCNIRCSAGK